ncbi:MAG: DNA replication and repair protein RecF [Acidobacteriota bacterium]
MQLSELSNQGFRNLSSDPVSFGAGVTLITGENAQGKTNLLEAVALVCGQRSFRGAAAASMARDGQSFSLGARLERRAGEERIAVSWSRQNGREFLRGDKPATFREISSLSPAVFLAPEHRELLAGAPALRRRFLDRLVLGWRPSAGDDLARYAMALRERNVLLARARRGQATAAGELEAWTEELCAAGSTVRRHRRDALAIWEREFVDLTRQAGPNYADIRVAYAAEGDAPEALRQACQRLLPLERRRGYSLAGPHRDDLVWTRGGKPLSQQASSGEASRTVALAKLAEWSVVAKASGELPLFGADDFDAGLSEAWVEELFDALPRAASVLLTSSSPPARWARRASAVWEMREGSVSARGMLRAVETG